MNLLTRMWSPISRFSSIEPLGILNACTTKVRAKMAKTMAISSASKYSRRRDLSLIGRPPARLADEMEGAPPAGAREEAEEGVAELAHPRAEPLPVAVGRLPAVRPVDEERPAFEQVGRQ